MFLQRIPLFITIYKPISIQSYTTKYTDIYHNSLYYRLQTYKPLQILLDLKFQTNVLNVL